MPYRYGEQSEIQDKKNRCQRVVAGAHSPVAALPGFRNFQEFLATANAFTLYGDLHAVGRIFRTEAMLLPGERPIRPIRLLLGIGFIRKSIPAVEIHPQFAAEISLRGGLCS